MAVEWAKVLLEGDQADNFVDLDDTPAALAGEGGKTVKVNVGADALEFVDVPAADHKAKVSADDTTEDYLLNKIVAGTGIAVTELTPGGDEDVEIKVDDLGVDTAQLAADAVTGDKIENDAVGSEHIEALDAALDVNGQQLTDAVIHNVADGDARDALTPVVGKLVYQVDEGHLYVCTSAA